MPKKNEETFLKITNKDIYDEIKATRLALNTFKDENNKGHRKIIEHQIKTNGKVKRNYMLVISVWFGLSTVLGWFIIHLMKI